MSVASPPRSDLSLGTVKKHPEYLQRKLDCHSAAEMRGPARRVIVVRDRQWEPTCPAIVRGGA